MDDKKKPTIVQIKNPKTGKYVKINAVNGRIIGYKTTVGPYKNIPIYHGNGEYEIRGVDKLFTDTDSKKESVQKPTPFINKTFFDFTYQCNHPDVDHCIDCYNKARKG